MLQREVNWRRPGDGILRRRWEKMRCRVWNAGAGRWEGGDGDDGRGWSRPGANGPAQAGRRRTAAAASLFATDARTPHGADGPPSGPYTLPLPPSGSAGGPLAARLSAQWYFFARYAPSVTRGAPCQARDATERCSLGGGQQEGEGGANNSNGGGGKARKAKKGSMGAVGDDDDALLFDDGDDDDGSAGPELDASVDLDSLGEQLGEQCRVCRERKGVSLLPCKRAIQLQLRRAEGCEQIRFIAYCLLLRILR